MPADSNDVFEKDLAWYEEGRQRRRHRMVAIGEARTKQLPSDSPIDLLNDYELFLDLPLSHRKRFYDLHSRTRQDCLYCWVIESVEPPDGLDVNVQLAETKLEAR